MRKSASIAEKVVKVGIGVFDRGQVEAIFED
jgi:hypothetical protein